MRPAGQEVSEVSKKLEPEQGLMICQIESAGLFGAQLALLCVPQTLLSEPQWPLSSSLAW